MKRFDSAVCDCLGDVLGLLVENVLERHVILDLLDPDEVVILDELDVDLQ